MARFSRKRLYEIVTVARTKDRASKCYDIVLMGFIFLGIIPLVTKMTSPIFTAIDYITTLVFLIDYLLRWVTADYKFKKGWKSFLIYPFSWMALFDLMSILPAITALNSSWMLLKTVRLIRICRVLRVFKSFRYSKNIRFIVNVFKSQKDSLFVVSWLAVAYIFLVSLVMFNVEPYNFDSFFDALYWATISLTGIGYGDLVPVSSFGRFIVMLSSLFGLALIALPAGIVTAGYMHEIDASKRKKFEKSKDIDEQENAKAADPSTAAITKYVTICNDVVSAKTETPDDANT